MGEYENPMEQKFVWVWNKWSKSDFHIILMFSEVSEKSEVGCYTIAEV